MFKSFLRGRHVGGFGRLVWAAALLGALPAATSRGADGRLTIAVADEQTGQPMAVRLEVRDSRGRVVRLQPEGATVAGGSIYFEGETTLELRRGVHSFLIEAGPEYLTYSGNFTIERNSEGSEEIRLSRRIDMNKEGWWAGDIDVQMAPATLPIAMRARGVSFVPITAIVNDHGRCRKLKAAKASDLDAGTAALWFGPWTTLDLRRGGGLLAVGGEELVDVCSFKSEDASLPSATAAREAGAQVVALTPFAWDLPIWVAAGQLDAVQIINRHSQLNAVVDDEAGGRPRDDALFPGTSGNGRYGESIYHHLLNCGLRLPPAAGSGAGAQYLPAKTPGGRGSREVGNPLGANRMYVQCGETCTREAWLEAWRAGRVFVTNGPLLRTRVAGEPPGHVFQLDRGERREFEIALDLAFYDATKVEYLEIIQNGRAIHTVRLDEFARSGGRLPKVEFETSGWFLVRAVTNNTDVYQFASTGPYYVETDYQPRISKASVEYFLEWLDAAAEKFAGNEPVLAEINGARPYWQGLLARANAE